MKRKVKYEIELEFGSDFQFECWGTIFDKMLQAFLNNFTEKHKGNHSHVVMKQD